jgi:putative NADPH-quinone reductase
MPKRITMIQGNPDPSGRRFGHALAEAYLHGAKEAGHEVRLIEVAKLSFPLLQTQEEWESGTLPDSLCEAPNAIGWAEHLVFFFPLWLGTMPAVLKAFLEQVARPGFAIGGDKHGKMPMKLLRGRSARIVVTMGMPAFVYRWYFLAHGLKGLERNILGFVGIAQIKETLIGMVDASNKKIGKSGCRNFGHSVVGENKYALLKLNGVKESTPIFHPLQQTTATGRL